MDNIDLNELCQSENISITQLDNLPTQELIDINNNAGKRFESVSVVSDEQLQQRKEERIPKNTRKQNNWAVSVYEEWANWRNSQAETLLGDSGLVPVELSAQSLVTMDYWLSRFILECRRKDGKPYPPATLYNITSSIQRHFREVCGRTDVNFLDKKDPNFAEFRKQLDSRMKELTNEGIGIHRNQADPVTEEDERQLWETGVIGFDSARALSYGVFFYNCKCFGFRGGDEHQNRNLDASQYKFTIKSGLRVLTFYGRNSKNVQGGLNQRKVDPKVVTHFENPDNPRCIVKLFSEYLKHVPVTGAFYRKPMANDLKGNIKFSSQVVGVNTLRTYMASMFSDAQIDCTGRNIRNHSGKVTLCTRMYEQEYDEQAIMSRSGHRSTAVRSYKSPSDAMLQKVSDSLQPPAPTQAKPPTVPEPVRHPDKKIKSETVSSESQLPSDSIEICVPETISTVIINKCGKKISINL